MKKINPYFSIQIKSFWLDFGWFYGDDDTALLKIDLLSTMNHCLFTIFAIHIIRFVFAFGFDYE